MNSTVPGVRANLRTVIALAGLFLLPLVAAFWLYYFAGWRPPGRTNHGELIEPARPLPAVELRSADGHPVRSTSVLTRRWALVYVGAGSCDEACQHALYVMRQTRLGLNADMTRAVRVFFADRDCCSPELRDPRYAGLVVLDAAGDQAQPLLKLFPVGDRRYTIFLVDPLGNLMMRYDSRLNPRGLLEDLKRLLQLSHIG